MILKVHFITDVGRVREHNEDALLVDEQLGLCIVCDGVGGEAAGEVAAQTTCKVIQDFIERNKSHLLQARKECNLFNRGKAIRLINAAVREANTKVYQMSHLDPSKHGMACTLAMILFLGPHALVTHAGDSRVYLVRQNRIHQLTEDHILAADHLKMGTQGLERLMSDPNRSLLTKVIGQQPNLEPDNLFMELTSGDRFLICSDGVSGYLNSEQLLEQFRKVKPVELPKRLVDLANQKGGADNITAVVVESDTANPQMDAEVKRKFDAVMQVALFKQFDTVEVLQLLNTCRIVNYDVNQKIIRRGEKKHELCVVISGEAAAIKNKKVLSRYGPGHFFGEMAMVDKKPRYATVVASKRSRIMFFDREGLFAMLNNHPRLAVKFLWPLCRVLNTRLRNTTDSYLNNTEEIESAHG